MQLQKKLFFISLLFLLISCKSVQQPDFKNTRIAFIADVHLNDIFGTFQDNDYKGIPNPVTGEYANIRTMGSQLHSTRIFNENYFAFIAALDDISKRGIKIVALPGDFSDDGQPVHLRGLKHILETYSTKFGMSFFVTTGNHDVVKPFAQDATKTDFLGQDGKEQVISSLKTNQVAKEGELKPIITEDIKNSGYKEMTSIMGPFGFFPKQSDLYWETPFSDYDYEEYSFDKALQQSNLSKRIYALKNTNLSLPDVSYLVEPVKGIWLLAIDANAYVPNEKLSGLPENPKDFSNASIGYNNVLLYKKLLIDWVKKVTETAKQKGKILIAFSHYPMVDFNDDASPELKSLLGENKMQLQRVPNEEVAQVFADAGIQIHFGGHMHINDTGVRTTTKGNTLFNIQTPSLAAYMPGYKILTIHSASEVEVETVVVDSVQKFNSLFPFYEQEYAHLKNTNNSKIWNKAILETKTYKEFTEWHLKELVRLRFLPDDWPVEFSKSVLKSSGEDLLFRDKEKETIEGIKRKLVSQGLAIQDFQKWNGFDMVFDFYRLRNADELAFLEIGTHRMKQYQFLCKEFENSKDNRLELWGKIVLKAMNGQPSNHFKINLKTNRIDRINP